MIAEGTFHDTEIAVTSKVSISDSFHQIAAVVAVVYDDPRIDGRDHQDLKILNV